MLCLWCWVFLLVIAKSPQLTEDETSLLNPQSSIPNFQGPQRPALPPSSPQTHKNSPLQKGLNTGLTTPTLLNFTAFLTLIPKTVSVSEERKLENWGNNNTLAELDSTRNPVYLRFCYLLSFAACFNICASGTVHTQSVLV